MSSPEHKPQAERDESMVSSKLGWIRTLRNMHGDVPLWDEVVDVVEAAAAERARDLVRLTDALPDDPATEDFERLAQSPEARARDHALNAVMEAINGL